MVTRKDICQCGHLREEHNNRIIKPYYPELKYNTCMEKAEDFFDELCFEILKKANEEDGSKNS